MFSISFLFIQTFTPRFSNNPSARRRWLHTLIPIRKQRTPSRLQVEKAIGSKEFTIFYLLCGIVSGALSFAVYVFMGEYRVFLLGASGAVYAVLFAYAVVFPRSIIFIWGFIPVPAPLLVLIYAGIEFFSQFNPGSNVAHMTHLFGFLAAWLYFVIRMGIHPVKIWKNTYR